MATQSYCQIDYFWPSLIFSELDEVFAARSETHVQIVANLETLEAQPEGLLSLFPAPMNGNCQGADLLQQRQVDHRPSS
jgi:hypothetical protein